MSNSSPYQKNYGAGRLRSFFSVSLALPEQSTISRNEINPVRHSFRDAKKSWLTASAQTFFRNAGRFLRWPDAF